MFVPWELGTSTCVSYVSPAAVVDTPVFLWIVYSSLSANFFSTHHNNKMIQFFLLCRSSTFLSFRSPAAKCDNQVGKTLDPSTRCIPKCCGRRRVFWVVCAGERASKIRTITQNRHNVPGSEEKLERERLLCCTVISLFWPLRRFSDVASCWLN